MIFNRQKEPLFVVVDVMRFIGYQDLSNIDAALSGVPQEWRGKAMIESELLDVLTYEGLMYFGGPSLSAWHSAKPVAFTLDNPLARVSLVHF